MKDRHNKPLGESIRDLINPALEDNRRQQIQQKILNDAFQFMVDRFDEILHMQFSKVFNMSAGMDQDTKNAFIIDQLTTVGRDGEAKYSPILRLPLPLSTGFTTFSADEVKDLPAYIELHMKARSLDVAVKVTGLLADESKTPSGFQLPALLIIDASRTYEEGAMENSQLYPNLPPEKTGANKASGNFDL